MNSERSIGFETKLKRISDKIWNYQKKISKLNLNNTNIINFRSPYNNEKENKYNKGIL